MIVVDSTIWVDHFRSEVPALVELLTHRVVLTHQLIIGEIAMGSLKDRAATLDRLGKLPHSPAARHDTVMELIQRAALFGTGLSFIDAALLASTKLFPGAHLWTRDKRLHEHAERLGLAYTP
jgi:predicted nucleic acid-binding protein